MLENIRSVLHHPFILFWFSEILPDYIYLFGVNNETSVCEICIKYKKHAWKTCKKSVKSTIHESTTWVTLSWWLHLRLERHLYNTVEHLQWSFSGKIVHNQKLKFSIGLTKYASGLSADFTHWSSGVSMTSKK